MNFDIIQAYLYQYTLIVPFAALIFAVIIKWIVHAINGKFSVSNMLGSWGMPSAHSTFVVALSTAMWLKHDVWSDEFTMCLVFSIIIIYDAMNVRFQAGLHARVLNDLTPHDGQFLNESIGHTPIEAFVWWVVGFITAVILLGV
jgi:acid phosphatase family membrane protein YuiD